MKHLSTIFFLTTVLITTVSCQGSDGDSPVVDSSLQYMAMESNHLSSCDADSVSRFISKFQSRTYTTEQKNTEEYNTIISNVSAVVINLKAAGWNDPVIVDFAVMP